MQESVCLAAVFVADDYEGDPTLNGEPAAFDDYLPAKLQWHVRGLDRKQHPHLYDKDTGEYLGAEGEWREGLTRDAGGDEGRDDTRGDGGDVHDEKWVRTVASKHKKKAREDVYDPTVFEVMSAIAGPGEQLSIHQYADRLARVMSKRRPAVAPATQIGVIRLAAETYFRGGEWLGGRKAAKELGHEDYIQRPASRQRNSPT